MSFPKGFYGVVQLVLLKLKVVGMKVENHQY